MMYYLQGLFWGLVYIMPIGMQNLYVINNAITGDRKRVMITDVSVIFFDIMLSLTCFYGVGFLLDENKFLQLVMMLVGSILVAYMGVKLWKAVPETEGGEIKKGCLSIIVMAGVVTWLNPQALLDGSIVLGAFKASLPQHTWLGFISGVCSASVVWFIALSGFAYFTRSYISDKILCGINKVCSTVLVCYAIKLGYEFFNSLKMYV